MANPVDFKGTNVDMTAPEGQEAEVQTVTAFTNGVCCVTAWEPTKAEIEDMVAGRPIYLSVYGRGGMPPVFIATEAMMRDHVAQYGDTFPDQAPTDAEIIMDLLHKLAGPNVAFTGQAELGDLGADTLDVFQFLTDVEECFDKISIADGEWSTKTTVQEVVDSILAKLAA